MGTYKRDIAWGAFFLAFAVFVWIVVPFQIADSGRTAMGPRFFPRVISIIMGTVSIGLIISNVIKYRKAEQKHGTAEEGGWKLDAGALRLELRAVGVFGIMVLYAILMPRIGFIISSIVASMIILLLLNARKWYYYVIMLAAVFLIYYVFKFQLYVQLP
jgi:hypothetical protein